MISKFLKFNTRLFTAGTKGRHLTISISTRILVEKIKFITGSRLTPAMCIRVAIPCPLGRENIRDRSVYTVFTRAHRGKQRWNNGVGRFDTHPSDVNSLALGRHLTSPRIFHHYSLPFPSSPTLLPAIPVPSIRAQREFAITGYIVSLWISSRRRWSRSSRTLLLAHRVER